MLVLVAISAGWICAGREFDIDPTPLFPARELSNWSTPVGDAGGMLPDAIMELIDSALDAGTSVVTWKADVITTAPVD